MQMGTGSPEALVSALSTQYAALSRQEKSLASASSRQSLIFEDVATATRRFFGPRNGAARQDILVAGDVEVSLGGDKDHEARAAYRKAKKQRMGKRKGDGLPKKSSDKDTGGRQRKK